MGIVHATRGANEPASPQLRSEVDIVCGIAAATLGEWPIDWAALAADYDRVREHIAAVIPGFDDFNARVRRPGGFALPNPPATARRSRQRPAGPGSRSTSSSPIVVPPGRLLLQTVRSHDQFNTTIYGLDDRYRGVSGGRRVVFVNPDDLAELGFADGDLVDIVSEWTDGSSAEPPRSGWSPTRRRRGAARRTSRRPTCSSPSTASPRAAAPRHRRRSSCASNPRAHRP